MVEIDEFLRETYELLKEKKIDEKEKEERLDKIHKHLREKEEFTIEKLEEIIPVEELLDMFPDVTEERIEKDSKSDPELSELLDEPGVLLCDKIKKLAEKYHLIFPFNKKNLKGASYYLTVGNEYSLGGKKGKLYNKPDKNKLEIPPFEVAIIKTREIINMPRFLIGRWNIRVTQAYEGLLWVGGPQVDPGWVGHLFCPIYNLSNETVVLKLGQRLATIDFVRTTSFKKDKCEEFDRKKARKRLEDYHWRLKSALLTEVAQRINKIEEKVVRLESMIGIVFMCIAILFAALSIFVTSGKYVSVSLPLWVYISVVLSILAIAISIFSRIRLTENWFKIIVIVWLIILSILTVKLTKPWLF